MMEHLREIITKQRARQSQPRKPRARGPRARRLARGFITIALRAQGPGALWATAIEPRASLRARGRKPGDRGASMQPLVLVNAVGLTPRLLPHAPRLKALAAAGWVRPLTEV